MSQWQVDEYINVVGLDQSVKKNVKEKEVSLIKKYFQDRSRKKIKKKKKTNGSFIRHMHL